LKAPAPTSIPNLKIDELLAGSLDQVRGSVSAVFEKLTLVISRHEGRIAHLELELKLREEQLRLARIQKYGPRGEKLSHDQMLLLDLEPGVQASEVEKESQLPDAEKQLNVPATRAKGLGQRAKRYSKVHPGRTPLPAHLPRREVILRCEEGAHGELIGYEVKEELVILPAEFFVQVLKREKRKVSAGGRSTILTAPMPPRIVDKGQLDNSVVVELMVGKYCDHLPIYRQLNKWDRECGLRLDDALPIRAVMTGGRLLQPLARLIGQRLKEGEFIQADETRVPVLQQEGKGRNDIAWFWQYSKPGGLVYFDYQSSRSGAGPGAFLNDFTGMLQSDGYEVYSALGRRLSGHAGCWAHARRKFDEARKAAPKEAPCQDSQSMLLLIAELYAVEAEARKQRLAPDARLQLRQLRDVPAKLKNIRLRIVDIRQRVLPASVLAKACDYALNQWEKLCVFAREGEVEIDNNWCENGMRPVALGRKNWMHLGCQESGPVVAAIMTVIASAGRAGLNPRHYLADVLGKMADRAFTNSQLPALLPENWSPPAPAAPL
jgi:transposase